MGQLKRRQFVFAAGSMLAARFALAQAGRKVHRVGILIASSLPHGSIPALPRKLTELGYVEGKDIVYEVRVADGHVERHRALIAELLALKVDVLMVSSSQAVKDAQKASRTVPIVFAGVFDPVGAGLVTSLARPGGNITGTTFAAGGKGFAGKWVDLLKETVPGLSRAAALWNPANPGVEDILSDMKTGAQRSAVKLELFEVTNGASLAKSLTAIESSGAQGLIVTSDPFMATHREKLVKFAASNRLPAVYFQKPFVDVGGLMSYGGSFEDSWQRAAMHVDKILKGAKAGEVPIDQPTKLELTINLKTAKALGIRLPHSLLIRADRVIE